MPPRRKALGFFVRILVIAALAGAVGWASAPLTRDLVRTGYAPRQVLVDSADPALDEDQLRESLSATVWGRTADIAVAIGSPEPTTPETDPDTARCDVTDDPESGPLAPLFSGSSPMPTTVYVCIDPATWREDVRTAIDKNPMIDREAEQAIGRLLATDDLTAATLTDVIQAVADNEGGYYQRPNTGGVLAAITLTAAILLGLGMSALEQLYRARTSLGALPEDSRSRRGRRQLAGHVYARYTAAAIDLDELYLLAYTATGPYAPSLAARYEAWVEHYTRLAAYLDATDADTLATLRSIEALASADHASQIVAAGASQIREDARALERGSADVGAHAIEEAIDAAEELRDDHLRTDEETLLDAETITRWRTRLAGALTRAEDNPADALAAVDDLTFEIAATCDPALAAYERDYGHPFPRVDAIEDPARTRGTDLTIGAHDGGTGDDEGAPKATRHAEDDVTDDAAADGDLEKAAKHTRKPKVRARARRLALPLSAAAVAGASALALIAATATAIISYTDMPESAQVAGSYAAAPDLGTASLYTEPSGEDAEALVHPGEVSVDDRADLIGAADEATLAEAARTLGFANVSAPRIVIATRSTEEKVALGQQPSTQSIAATMPDLVQVNTHGDLEAIQADTIVVWWLAEQPDEHGYRRIDPGLATGGDLAETLATYRTYRGKWLPDSALLSVDKTAAQSTWNALVALTYVTRGIDEDTPHTVASTTQPATRAIVAGLAVFVTALVVLGTVATVRERRRRREAAIHEVQAAFTRLSTAADDLELEATLAEQTFPKYAPYLRRRVQSWEDAYVALVRARGEEGKPAPLEEQVRAARAATVRARQLRSVRVILGRGAGWREAWEWESSVAAAILTATPGGHADTVARVTNALARDEMGPREALEALDEALARVSVKAVARAYRVRGDLVALSADAADAPRPIAVGAVAFTLPPQLGRHRVATRILVTALVVAVALTVTIGLRPSSTYLSDSISVGDPVNQDAHVPPAEVAVEDDADLFDDERVREAAESAAVPVAARILIISGAPGEYGEPMPLDTRSHPGILAANTTRVTSAEATPRSLVIAVDGQQLWLIDSGGSTAASQRGLRFSSEARAAAAVYQGGDATEAILTVLGVASLASWQADR